MPKKGNNEGSVYKDKRGRWTGSVTLPSVNGKVRKNTFMVKQKKKCLTKSIHFLWKLRTTHT